MAGGGTDYGMATPTQTGFGVASNRQTGINVAASNREVISSTHKVGSTLVSLYTSSATAAKGVLLSPESLTINNSGGAATAVIVKLNYWTAANTKDDNAKYLQFSVAANETVNIPMSKVIISDDADTIYSGTALTDYTPSSNMYLNVTSDHSSGSGDQQLDGAINDSTSTTTVTVDDGDYFRAGDLIRVDDEIMEVTSISGDNLTVIRATHGSTIAAHSDNVNIRFPFFNAYHNFTAAKGGYDKVQTDNDGKYKAMNLMAVGRGLNYTTQGILQGSVSIKFYQSGYQELGLSGITPNTNTGLTAGTTYDFTIAVDGGSAFETAFTVDANNTNFGGRNGVLSKIQSVFDAAYYTAGHLFEKRVTVGIVNGDVRFTSGSCLSTSAIALGTESSGDTDIWGVGRIPLVTKVETAVAAKLPSDTLSVTGTGQSISNNDVFMYDDGK